MSKHELVEQQLDGNKKRGISDSAHRPPIPIPMMHRPNPDTERVRQVLPTPAYFYEARA